MTSQPGICSLLFALCSLLFALCRRLFEECGLCRTAGYRMWPSARHVFALAVFLCSVAVAGRRADADVWFQYTNSNGDTTFSFSFYSGGWQDYGNGMGGAVVYPLGYSPTYYYYYPAAVGPTYPTPPGSMPYYLRRVYAGPGLLPFSWDRYGTLVDGPVKPLPTQERSCQLRYNRAMARGREIMKLGDFRTATEFFRAAVLEDTNRPEAKAFLALALLGTSEYSLAAKALRRAVADSAQLDVLLQDMRSVFADEKSFETCLNSLKAWRDLKNDASSGLLLAYLLAISGRKAEGVAALEQALKVEPGDAELSKLLAALRPQEK